MGAADYKRMKLIRIAGKVVYLEFVGRVSNQQVTSSANAASTRDELCQPPRTPDAKNTAASTPRAAFGASRELPTAPLTLIPPRGYGCLSELAEGRADSLEGEVDVLVGVERGDADVALSGRAEAGAWGSHHVGLLEQVVEELP